MPYSFIFDVLFLLSFTFLTILYIRDKYSTSKLLSNWKKDPEGHIFIELKTLGALQDAPILVIEVCAIDSSSGEIDERRWRIDPDSAISYGTTDPAVEKWWNDQPQEVKDEAFKQGPRISLQEALKGLSGFIGYRFYHYGDRCFIWGNSPSFECSILRHAYGAVGLEIPWGYAQERDVRTVAWLGRGVKKLDSSHSQGQNVVHIIKKLRQYAK